VIVRVIAARTLVALLTFCGTVSGQAQAGPVSRPLPPSPTAITHHRPAPPNGRHLAYAFYLDGTIQAERPVAFLRSGGPRSSALWPHVGSFAPVYRSGHMIHLEPASRRALRADIETFIRGATRK
jgi:hypothetical protein